METSLFRYILKHSLKQQVLLTALALASFIPLYMSYEVPKTIINQAIQGKKIAYPHSILGLSLEQVEYLVLMCLVFLSLVIVNQGFKYVIHVLAGLTAERMLRRLRYELFARVLRFPLPVFRRMSAGEVIPMITSEVEPLGGFIGESFSLPAQQGGTLLTILGFLLIQNPAMAAAAVSLYPLQLWLIPKLQNKVNQLGKERVRAVRRVSDRIGENIAGVQEIHAHDAANRELADFSDRMGNIFFIRLRIYILKFLVKFLNNFIQQLGPFVFFLFGGYLVITGSLDIGTLLAALTAHKDLAAPWKELLTYYQLKEDARIKYEQVISQFDPPGLKDERLQTVEPDKVEPLVGEITVAGLTYQDDQNVTLVDNIALTARLDRHLAIVGAGQSGKDELCLLLAGLLAPTKGTVAIGGHNLAETSEAITGRRITHVGASAFIFNGTIGSNLFYGLRHRPPKDHVYSEAREKERGRMIKEALASANSPDDHALDWTDYAAAGAKDAASLATEALRVLHLVDLEKDVYLLGLRGRIDAAARPEIAAAVLKARAALKERLTDPAIAHLVEIYDRERFNSNATIAENLIFGTPIEGAIDMDHIGEHPYIAKIMVKVGLDVLMLAAGRETAQTMVELFTGLPPEHEFFQQFAFISADDLPEYKAILGRAEKMTDLRQLAEADRALLISLPFKVIPARHRLGIDTPELVAKVLEGRRVFAADLPADLKGKIDFFDHDAYNPAHTVLDNILFGKIAHGIAQASERVGALVGELVEQLGLHQAVVEVGLSYEVGIAGGRLTASQRQRLAIARALLKRPDLLILSEATAMLDARTQTHLFNAVREECKGRGLIWALHRASLAREFDQVAVLHEGKIVAQGKPEDVDSEGGRFRELVAAE
ncbi:MAG: ATP-binding cassette domain-containing protein [Alphaproteobacteria bacterium]|nr:ATP-binding cassette domain-containing protein [Alphaproteobacteria bacterium]